MLFLFDIFYFFAEKAQGNTYMAAVVEHSPVGPEGSSSTQDEANAFKAQNLEAYLVSIEEQEEHTTNNSSTKTKRREIDNHITS